MSYRRKAPAKRKRTTARKFRPGYNRTGGYYGRFGTTGRYKRGTYKNQREKKFFDRTATGSLSTDTEVASYFSANLIPQGTGMGERIGRKIVATSWHVRGWIDPLYFTFNPEAGSSYFRAVRFLVVQDTQANGDYPQLSEILDITETGTKYINAMRNLANTSRFRVLKDKVRKVNVNSSHLLTPEISMEAYAYNAAVHFKMDLKLNVPIYFDDINGNISEIRSNNLLFWFILDVNHANDSGKFVEYNFSTRLRYEDS